MKTGMALSPGVWPAGCTVSTSANFQEQKFCDRKRQLSNYGSLAGHKWSSDLLTTFLDSTSQYARRGCIHRIAGRPRSLAIYLDYAFANYRQAGDMQLSNAVADYLAVKCKAGHGRCFSHGSSIRSRLSWLPFSDTSSINLVVISAIRSAF